MSGRGHSASTLSMHIHWIRDVSHVKQTNKYLFSYKASYRVLCPKLFRISITFNSMVTV